MIFTTHGSDHNGVQCLQILTRLGYQTQVLNVNKQVPESAIAIFTPLNPEKLSGRCGRFLRTSSVKLDNDFTPQWARASKFRVAVLKLLKTKKSGPQPAKLGIEQALLNVARDYQAWFKEGSTELVPWPCGKQPSQKTLNWLSEVSGVKSNMTIKKSVEEDITTVAVGQWEVNFCKKVVPFPAWAAEQGAKFLGQWKHHFTQEDTWAQRVLEIPSLFVRFDCVIQDGQLVVYEIEERPAGFGISSHVSPEFTRVLQTAANNWPEFRVEVSPLRRATDDSLWLQHMDWNPGAELVLVRAEPEETEFHNLEGVSVSSLKAKGNKSYGVNMGWWKQVQKGQPLPWNEPFVLKPLKGSKVRDLQFWDPQSRPGSSKRAVVEQELNKQSSMFLQRLHPPMKTGIEKYPWMIYRIFYAYNPSRKSWDCLGGNWNARHNLRIHGASDAVFGPSPVE